jgi:hypothetical protein
MIESFLNSISPSIWSSHCEVLLWVASDDTDEALDIDWDLGLWNLGASELLNRAGSEALHIQVSDVGTNF